MTGRRPQPLPLHAALPAPPEGWFDISVAAARDGGLLLARCDHDLNTIRRRERERTGRASGQRPAGARLRLSVLDGSGESGATVTRLEESLPLVDRLPDGGWIIADSRRAAGGPNARLVGADGAVIRRFPLGDAIQQLGCDRSGRIWVGYLDQGVFGDDVGQAGLAAFDASGRLLRDHNAAAPAGAFISDCYTLNAEDGVWACGYADFPLIRYETPQAEPDCWAGVAEGVRALAVEDDLVALAGGYEGARDRVVLAQFAAGRLDVLATFDAGDGAEAIWLGRGPYLHRVGGGTWRRARVSTVADLATA